MSETAIIGAGKLASNLAAALKGSIWQPSQVISRSKDRAGAFAHSFSIPHHSANLNELRKEVSVILIATQDLAIAEVALQLSQVAQGDAVVFHCSGSVPLSALDCFGERAGVLYPLQTFTSEKFADFRTIPIFTESRSQSRETLQAIARHLSGRVQELDSSGRKTLHLGAVFACNFPNLMWILASELLKGLPGVDLSVYEPLVRQNVDNVFLMGAERALTGPARRRDLETLVSHLHQLEHLPELRHIYELLSDAIIQRNSRA